MKILSKKILAGKDLSRIIRIDIYAPHIAVNVRPGQFVIVMVNEHGERVPLTVVDKNKDNITLIFQEAGLTTRLLGKLETGNSLYALAGPLGNPTGIKNYGDVILAGGGVGSAEIYPVAKALKEEGNRVITILGSRTKDLLILENELNDVSNEMHITTDDGTYGRKGFVTDILKELLLKQKYDLIYAVGPIPMMRNVSIVSGEFSVQTVVSLNTLMVDATGMCGSCRVTVGGKTYFSCIDGPEFDAHLVDWDELIKRNSVYQEQEKHICKLYSFHLKSGNYAD